MSWWPQRGHLHNMICTSKTLRIWRGLGKPTSDCRSGWKPRPSRPASIDFTYSSDFPGSPSGYAGCPCAWCFAIPLGCFLFEYAALEADDMLIAPSCSKVDSMERATSLDANSTKLDFRNLKAVSRHMLGPYSSLSSGLFHWRWSTL